jgi:hypothetical protein
MGIGRKDEIHKGAVRITLMSGRSRRQVADDLGVGLSTLNNWVATQCACAQQSACSVLMKLPPDYW